jgi:hypothetical protein
MPSVKRASHLGGGTGGRFVSLPINLKERVARVDRTRHLFSTEEMVTATKAYAKRQLERAKVARRDFRPTEDWGDMYGPDTQRLQIRLNAMVTSFHAGLNLTGLNITGIPPLPDSVKWLECRNIPGLKELPELPRQLERLDCGGSGIERLPRLPPALEILWIDRCPITELPPLPPGLHYFSGEGCPLEIKRGYTEHITNYEARWALLREERASRARAMARCAALKEEMVMEAFSPARVARAEAAGYELTDL